MTFLKGYMPKNTFKKGYTPHNKGKHISEETKKKISNALKGRMPKNINRIKCWNKGIKGSTPLGQNHYNWRGGITSENKKIRVSIEYRLWREAVFARDNWTCQECKIKGGKLHAHHKKSFAKYPDLRFAIDNGITFCKKCHKKTFKGKERSYGK